MPHNPDTDDPSCFWVLTAAVVIAVVFTGFMVVVSQLVHHWIP
jgi:hypothetical protein